MMIKRASRVLLLEYPADTSHEHYIIRLPYGVVPPRCLMNNWASLGEFPESSAIQSIQMVGPTGWLRSGWADHIQEALEAEGFVVERKAD